VPGDQIEVNSISLVLVVPTCQYRSLGCPKWGIPASHMDMVVGPTFDLGHRVVVGMYTDTTHVDMGVEVSTWVY
jgi:hypothetical protein